MSQEFRRTLDRVLNAPISTLGETSVTLVTIIVFLLLVVGTMVVSRLA